MRRSRKVKKMEITIKLQEEILGTASANPEVHEEFIASKGPDAHSMAEEVAAVGVAAYVDKAMTVFPRNDKGEPFMYDYQLKGFFKDACSMMRRVPDSRSSKLKAHKKIIDGLIFVHPRQIVFNLPEGTEMGNCQRPLRGQTPQGERIALANSETIPAGTTLDVEIECLDPKLEKVVEEWLDYGTKRGLGQWRNSGKGIFSWDKK